MGERLEFEHCFVCGPKNPVGLHLDIHREDKRTWCRWKAGRDYVGYDDILHGGVLAAIMDDMMAHAAYSIGKMWRRPTWKLISEPRHMREICWTVKAT